MVENPDALECALTALRDRTPGIVAWSAEYENGQYTGLGYILIDADGRAVRRKWGWEDLTFVVYDAELGELAAPAFYDECLAGDDDARFDCLTDTLLVSVDAVCDGGWEHSAI